jgi:DNA-binding FadR family transcriptional regulator
VVTDSPTFQPVRAVRLYERIVEQIEALLVSGELKPGHRLPSERELVAQFGASRSTVREALRVLESNGVVRSRPGDPHGPEVLPYSSGALEKQLTRLARVSELSLSELIGSRMILDAAANRLAARLRTPGELREMEATHQAMRDAIEVGYAAFSEADVAFHEAVARASRNAMIQVCNAVVRDVVLGLISTKISRSGDAPALMRQSVEHHGEVLDAIRAGDGERAARDSTRSLYDYYSGYLTPVEREPLLALLD